MPPTDAAMMMELFARLFCNPPGKALDDDTPAPGDSFLCPPLPGMNGPPQSLAEIYGPDGQLLTHMADIAETRGETHLADLLRQISELADDPDFQPEPTENPPARLVEYVYPVV